MKRLTIISILLTAVALVAVGCSAKQDVIASPDSSPTLTPLPSTTPASVLPGTQGLDATQSDAVPGTENQRAIGTADAAVVGDDVIGTLPEANENAPITPSQQ